ncbi:hydrogenase nickel incorporation protein HypB [Amycolatopsis sp. BJA-103]|uniref:hydrogenase nickel incorporation protein HypB n=1 Tax=Amycolatopsis sp. BJA-103 TaxID=1911175 RepID=UPI000C772431|nr:hydrogenase nickel incorporation protein HypB [Amycolatopsis sp. BJA-103]AUI59223.1 hydrogenase accessory protein HypB [Amycolatopsis sp. BJA-103]PNE17330.1 hydrogenase accessory protein HypB [Amycolatopsis sp. BJA-103]
MCATCGCSDDAGVRVIDPSSAGHEHGHGHGHSHPEPDRTVLLEQDILAANDRLAADNRTWLAARGIHTLNVMSSPGSGKTTLLARTIVDRGRTLPMSVIEGDQETIFDAERIRATGCRVVQINTGAGCHLDAGMLAKALHTLAPPPRSTVFIENVGNLVCPALFDLGEAARVVVMSVTEGADKPLKYPHMFRTADVVLLNKIDLLPYVDFDVESFTEDLTRVNPRPEVLCLSATTGTGLDEWYGWLDGRES